MNSKKSVLDFPGDFPIKILGKANFAFESTVLTIIRKHIPNLPEGAIQLKTSEKGNYLSITAVLHVENQTQLDNLYRELVASELVLMVL
jgi:uncharacterized protein